MILRGHKRTLELQRASTKRSALPFVFATLPWIGVAHAADSAPPAETVGPAPTEVVVRGDAVRDPVGGRDPGVASSVVSRAELAAPGLVAEDVLRTQPGVLITQSGGFGAPSSAAIRGGTAMDTPVYLGGVRLNDDVGGTADLSMIPLWLIERVEVYRGNAPIDADRLGPGGAIFFEPKRPTGEMGGVGYFGGSWGASRGWAYEGIRTGPVSALVGVSGESATNRYPFVNDHGTLFEPGTATLDYRRNADERTLEGWGLARIEVGRGASLDLLVNEISRDQGVPSLALLQTREAREHAERTLASVGTRIPLGGDERFVIDSRTSLLIGRAHYDDPLEELALYTRELTIVGRRVEQSLAGTLALTPKLTIRPVLSLAREGIDRIPDNIPLGHAARDFARAAVSGTADISPALRIRALGSVECHHTGREADDFCDVLAPTGRIGVETGGDRVRVFANAGRYVRVPTLGEVYGVSGMIHGNPALIPEAGFTVDLGLRAQTRRGDILRGAYIDAFAFAHYANNLIAYERTGLGYVTPYNVGSARVLGAEMLGGIGITNIVRAEVSATLLDPRDTSSNRTTSNDILPFRSRLVAGPRLRAEWKRQCRGGLSAVGAEIRALYQSSRYADPAGLVVIGAQTTVDLEASASWFDGLLTVRGRAADVFNATRTDIIGFPLPGRSLYFGLETTW